MRLFTGISLSASVVERLNDVVETLKPLAKLQWSPPENLHLTTRFLGEWPEEKTGEVLSALKHMPKPGPFAIEIEGLDLFPGTDAPRVLFARVTAPAELAELARLTDAALVSVGVAGERRPYAPHVTLARIKAGAFTAAFNDALAAQQTTRFGRSEVIEFHLYLSEPAPKGSVYRKLANFDLKSAL